MADTPTELPLPLPVQVALATTVRTLPAGHDEVYEPKFDGHRLILICTSAGVLTQTRSGRYTRAFPDIVLAANRLPTGTVLDGEVIIWSANRLDFSAVQRRAASTARRAELLARHLPASYAAFDILALSGEPTLQLPLSERRALLIELLAPLGPPLQPVPQTDDPALANTWYRDLPAATGIEGLVIKRASSPYRAGRGSGWRKLRHADTTEAAVLGLIGPARRPRALLLQLPGRTGPERSSPLAPEIAAQIAALAGAVHQTPLLTAGDGTAYRPIPPGLEVEVLAGTTARHAALVVTRVRLSG
ncbi:ATP-dependent DNA ligase [Streptomyces xiamenensis]|uniref:ATP-dependent DNA ligase n=1 Tax=Streptomyces xiamenensis TaxID=408015 RepID=UPI0035D9D425